MKLFRLIGTMTIVAAVAATMAVSASAATATYENDAVKVTPAADAVETGYTVLITSAQENADPAEEEIYQLYQNANLDAEIALPADLAPGKYYVRVGGIETGIENTSFVKALEVAATGAMQDAENAEDDAVAYYYANATVPAGLLPYWTNGVKTIAATEGWAAVEGNVVLGLTVSGADAVDSAMALIWK